MTHLELNLLFTFAATGVLGFFAGWHFCGSTKKAEGRAAERKHLWPIIAQLEADNEQMERLIHAQGGQLEWFSREMDGVKAMHAKQLAEQEQQILEAKFRQIADASVSEVEA